MSWYEGLPFSPHYLRHYVRWKENKKYTAPCSIDYSGFGLQLYKYNKRILDFTKEGSRGELLVLSRSPLSIAFEKNTLSYEEKKVVITLDFFTYAKKMQIKAKLNFVRNVVKAPDHVDYEKDSGYTWVVSAPYYKVNGFLHIIEGKKPQEMFISFNGDGYHDKRFGSLPMHEHILEWTLGHLMGESIFVLYAFAKNKQGQTYTFFIPILRGRVFKTSSCFNVKMEKGILGSSQRRYTLEGHSFQLHVEENSQLKNFSSYKRFQTKGRFIFPNGDQVSMRGLSEYILPKRNTFLITQWMLRGLIWKRSKKSLMFFLYQKWQEFFSQSKREIWTGNK